MAETGIHGTQIILLLLLLFVAAFAALAQRLQTPYPIVLVVAGLLLSFVPGIPTISLDPDLIFMVVLPPLLYSAAWVTSWRSFSRNFVSIAMLAVGLVGFTVWAVAKAGPWLFAGFDWRIGFALGAAVATTDAIAATSIANRIGLPKIVVDLLEGESLINDATGLLALEFASMIVVNGQNPTLGAGSLRLLYLSGAAVVTGLAIAWVVERFSRRLDEGPIVIAVSILVPYAAYLAAEQIHASGILAVVAAGLYLGSKSSEFLSPTLRLQRRAFWDSVTFILNGLVFVLIGLQLPSVMAGVRELSIPRAIFYAAVFSLFLIALRLLWTFPGAYVAHFIRTRWLHQRADQPTAGNVFVLGWTGMRGVIALAAAMSLPQTIADGSPFPHRDLIIFLTFSVILVTLVFQGLTLSPLIRFLGLTENESKKCEERQARRLVLEAPLSHLSQIRQNDSGSFAAVYADLEQHYQHRLASVAVDSLEDESGDTAQHYQNHLKLSRELLDVERQTARRLRNEGRIDDDFLRELEHEMDLNETRLLAAIES